MRALRLVGVLAALLCVTASPAFAQSSASLANGARAPFVAPVECAPLGALCTTGSDALRVTSVNSALIVKATAGMLYGYNVVAGASAGYVLVIDTNFVQADGAVTPAMCMPLAANSGITVDLSTPVNFTGGIVLVFSTTGCFTKTASATAFMSATYK